MPTFKLDVKEGIINVFAELSGPRGLRVIKMLLDTGASYTIIPHEVAMAIGYEPSQSKRKIEFITASGVEYAPILNIKRIKALGFEIKNLDVVCHNLPPQSIVDGLLGLNFLTHFNISLKFLDKILEIEK